MKTNLETSETNNVKQAQIWAEVEIRAAGLDPEGPEAAFHRFRTMVFGTMGVQPPNEKQVHGKSVEGVLPWIDPSSGIPRKMTPHLRGGQR